MPMKQITVLLAEDHEIVRQGIRSLMKLERDIEIVGEAENGQEVLELTRKLRPEVVVMDIAMPLLTGLEATRQILKAVPATKVLLLSAQSGDSYIQDALESGAMGFLLKQTSARVLATAIREVQKGNVFFSPSIARHLRHQYQKSSDGKRLVKNRSACLTPREVEVLRLVAESKANKQTAAELGIALTTVDKHREHLMRKLNIHDTASLTRYAINEGIMEINVQATIT